MRKSAISSGDKAFFCQHCQIFLTSFITQNAICIVLNDEKGNASTDLPYMLQKSIQNVLTTTHFTQCRELNYVWYIKSNPAEI